MAAAVAASSASVAPSPFSALLRRSKFASFDPAIAQVYRTHDGDAHRGNWGLKRPLAMRRRDGGAMITVAAVDSRYQQTEWSSRESDARLVRKLEELDVHVKYVDNPRAQWSAVMGTAGGVNWLVDSEFASKNVGRGKMLEEEDAVVDVDVVVEEDAWGGMDAGVEMDTKGQGRNGHDRPRPKYKGHHSAAVPNIHAMTDKQFERYLSKLRKLRPEFQEYLREQGEDDPRVQGQSLFAIAQKHLTHHQHFIASHTAIGYRSRDSRFIQQRPHPTAGLVYSHAPPMQTYLTTKPKPGFYLHRQEGHDRFTMRYGGDAITSFAGMAAGAKRMHLFGREKPLLELKSEHGINRDRADMSVAQFRLRQIPTFINAPSVVGRMREGLDVTGLSAQVYAKEPSPHRMNRHMPGTREYVAMREDLPPSRHVQLMPFVPPARLSAADVMRTSKPQALIPLLSKIVTDLHARNALLEGESEGEKKHDGRYSWDE
jgi:hypothetical protein